jgi:Tfp pilus assembly protein PilV
MASINMDRKTGFSFVEIALAVVIIGLIMVPLLSMLTISNSGTVKNKNDILAQHYAANLLAYASTLSYDDTFLKSCADTEADLLTINSAGEELKMSMEPSFKRTYSIEEVKPPGWKYSYKLIKAVVKWKENKKTERSCEMVGLISKSRDA